MACNNANGNNNASSTTQHNNSKLTQPYRLWEKGWYEQEKCGVSFIQAQSRQVRLLERQACKPGYTT
jgi:hypothetical protein